MAGRKLDVPIRVFGKPRFGGALRVERGTARIMFIYKAPYRCLKNAVLNQRLF
jgi:hypothetical protein